MDAVFPVDQLRPLYAELFQGPQLEGRHTANCEVHFAPFELPNPNNDEASEDYEPLTFESPLRLDFIDLPSLNLDVLAGQTFTFPVNPEPCYIDGSVYFVGAHNPVDITRITFGTLTEHGLPVIFEGTWLMEFEASGFQDFAVTIRTTLRLREVQNHTDSHDG